MESQSSLWTFKSTNGDQIFKFARSGDKESHKEGREEENIPKSRQGQPIWHVYSRREKRGHVEEGKNDQLEKGITDWDGCKKEGS